MVEEFLEALLRQRALVLACKNKLHKTNQQILSVKMEAVYHGFLNFR